MEDIKNLIQDATACMIIKEDKNSKNDDIESSIKPLDILENKEKVDGKISIQSEELSCGKVVIVRGEKILPLITENEISKTKNIILLIEPDHKKLRLLTERSNRFIFEGFSAKNTDTQIKKQSFFSQLNNKKVNIKRELNVKEVGITESKYKANEMLLSANINNLKVLEENDHSNTTNDSILNLNHSQNQNKFENRVSNIDEKRKKAKTFKLAPKKLKKCNFKKIELHQKKKNKLSTILVRKENKNIPNLSFFGKVFSIWRRLEKKISQLMF